MSTATDAGHTEQQHALCVAVPGSLEIIDVLTKDAAGAMVGRFSRSPVDALLASKAGAVVARLDQVAAEIEASHITEPQAITADEWMEALEALPPIRWRTVLGVEIFQMSERYSGRVTGTYARIGRSHYRWRDRDNESHERLAHKAGAVHQRVTA